MNQQKPRTSIIMPVYNTEASVVRAIKSVQAQTDPDWELLVIIDASPDHAKDVIEQYLEANPDPRVRVFAFDENRGVSAARNKGLQEAKGAWRAFLDSDDAYEANFLECLHKTAAAAHADVAICNHRLLYSDGQSRDRVRNKPLKDDGAKAARSLLAEGLTPYIWDKIFRESVVSEVRFAEYIHRAEDVLYVLSAVLRSQKVAVVERALYLYSVDSGGLTWARQTPIEETDSLVASAERILHEHGASDLTKSKEYSSFLANVYLNTAQQAIVNNRDEWRGKVSACASRLRFTDLWNCFYVRPLFAVAVMLLKVSPGLYRSLYSMYIKSRYGITNR